MEDKNDLVKNPLQSLEKIDAKSLIHLIKAKELHPYHIAVMMCYMDSKKSAEILTYLDIKEQKLIIENINYIVPNDLHKKVVREIDDYIIEHAKEIEEYEVVNPIGGMDTIANILSESNFNTSEIFEGDEDLISAISEGIMNIKKDRIKFEYILNLSDLDMQKVLSEPINDRNIAILLKVLSEENFACMQEKLQKNMSKRRWTALNEELNTIEMVPESELLRAQDMLIKKIITLAENGEINLHY